MEEQATESAPDATAPEPTAPEIIERVEMVVEHMVRVQQAHLLVGKCPRCAKQIETGDPNAVAAFEQGKSASCTCDCGALLTVPGRSKLIKPRDMGKIVQLNQGPNRHQRRLQAKRP